MGLAEQTLLRWVVLGQITHLSPNHHYAVPRDTTRIQLEHARSIEPEEDPRRG